MSKNQNLYFFIIIVFLLSSVLLVRLFDLTMLSEKKIKKNVFRSQSVYRKNILDRNGMLLATDLVVYSVYTNPRKIKNPKDSAEKLHSVLIDVPYEKIYKSLSAKNTSFSWIKRNITPKEKLLLDELGLAGIYFEKTYKRIYLTQNLFSHIIGYVNTDNFGIAGIELFLNKNSSNLSNNLELSLDGRVQTIMHNKMEEAVLEFNAEGAAGVVLDVKNGEIISLVSLPDFDPNHPQNYNDNEKFNRATLGIYEFGSIIKMITVAAALDNEMIGLDDHFEIEDKIKIDKHIVTDYKKSKKPTLSVTEIISTSSNIGMVKILLTIGTEKQQAYFKKLGFLSQLNIEISEKASSLLPKKWDDVSGATISYGYGIATTLVHVAQAFAALVNDGCFYGATLIKNNKHQCENILDYETSEKLRFLLLNVVKEGTGKLADFSDYDIGGKSGSAEKIIDGKYHKNSSIVSFVAAFPIKNPRYVIAIMVDEPKTSKPITGGYLVAPIVKKVVERISPILGIEPKS